MAELKTQKNDGDVTAFLNAVPDEQKRQDCFAVLQIMQQITGAKPYMWGDSIVGFGAYRYKYRSGREAEWFLTGFSPRKQNLTLYIMAGFGRHKELMAQLGKYKTGQSCLYLKRLSDIDTEVLKELVRESVAYMTERSQ
ncbi:MAG TPA: DUF1801 domain-containing protein [Flavilitoribacter sp.]|nr:DUF1801 domain-containing protein [Flavilitoribacter sp.]HMQ89092.1 DUF1801 domain-containing protein [Flavilitoribacter sp.]